MKTLGIVFLSVVLISLGYANEQAMFCYNNAARGQTCTEAIRLQRSGANCREQLKAQVDCYKRTFTNNCNRDFRSYWPTICKKLINVPGAQSNKPCYDYAIGLCN